MLAEWNYISIKLLKLFVKYKWWIYLLFNVLQLTVRNYSPLIYFVNMIYQYIFSTCRCMHLWWNNFPKSFCLNRCFIYSFIHLFIQYQIFFFKVGHEPIAPSKTTTFFGKTVYRLPNFLQYGKNIFMIINFVFFILQ